MRHMYASVAVFTSILFASTLTNAAAPTADTDRHGQVLASARSLDGRGLIEIVRISEDGIDGVVVSSEFPIAAPNTYVTRDPNAPLSERARLMFERVTGKRLPEAAYEALLDVEIAKEEAIATEYAVDADPLYQPRAACVDQTPNSDQFRFDCYGYGPRAIVKSGTDDVCLLTAAIEGDHTMQISYKAINGNFYNSFNANVAEGHYRAAEIKSAVKRTRKGQIVNASNAEYSRFEFSGTYSVWPFDPNFSDCTKAVN
jgi:hypothetical protein